MTDSVVQYYYSWTKYFADLIPTDSLFVITSALYVALFLALLAFKITSYDADVYYASKNVLKYLKDKGKVRKGSLNYYMRGMPKKVYAAWENYCLEKDGKPSNYLTPDLSYTFGALEKGFATAFKIIVFVGTVINMIFALCNPKFEVVEALFLPGMTAIIGMILIAITEINFTIFKRNADKKFRQVVKALDVYEAHLIVPKMFANPNVSSKLKEDLDKILSDAPENVLVKDSKVE